MAQGLLFPCSSTLVAHWHRARPRKAHDVYQNILQTVVWESIFFNRGAAWSKMTRLRAISVNGWLPDNYVFGGFSVSQIRWNGVAVTVQSHRRYGVIALPLRCNRDAVTVQSRRDYSVTAKILGQKPTDGIAEGLKATLFPLYLPLFPSVKFRQ